MIGILGRVSIYLNIGLLFEYRPSDKGDKVKSRDNMEPLQRADYVENMGRVRSDRFHGKLKEYYPKKERGIGDNKNIRREQEGILAELGIKNIPYILSFPVVKEITREVVRKRRNGEDYRGGRWRN